mmetsp:Transcript_92576/g.288609  ORF Transcript_92576/g.288609 Transcript_92576/m.288609 type:complete len:302 (+) Transcript_92576:141-1046(+)
MAQQASMGVLALLDGEGDGDGQLLYRLPRAMATVLADPDSPDYDISLIQLVPSLMSRARSALPQAFKTGVGQPYDEPDISEAIDRQHRSHIRHCFIPQVIPMADARAGGTLLAALDRGTTVAELGCGGGNMLLALAKAYPRSQFHGFEVSQPALDLAEIRVKASGCTNVVLHAADSRLGSNGQKFDVVTTYDVLHDATDPAGLIADVRKALHPETGVWLLGDICGRDSLRENVRSNPMAATMYSFSTCLCMSSALSAKGGAGLGTLGFTRRVARRMLAEGGFSRTEVLKEEGTTRWFLVRP